MKKTLREITKNIDMVLFNQVSQKGFNLELEVWNEYQKYSDVYLKEQFEEEKENGSIEENADYNDLDYESPKDLYQFFAINKNDWKYLAEKCDFPLFYVEELDLFVIWIDFLDNWSNQSYNI